MSRASEELALPCANTSPHLALQLCPYFTTIASALGSSQRCLCAQPCSFTLPPSESNTHEVHTREKEVRQDGIYIFCSSSCVYYIDEVEVSPEHKAPIRDRLKHDTDNESNKLTQPIRTSLFYHWASPTSNLSYISPEPSRKKSHSVTSRMGVNVHLCDCRAEFADFILSAIPPSSTSRYWNWPLYAFSRCQVPSPQGLICQY
jgi:hypothetical protein